MTLPRTLFLANGSSAVAWYRCALPATALGCDWSGVLGRPPDVVAVTGRSNGRPLDVSGYDVVVVQLVKGRAWMRTIRRWQEQGITVLYEIDDWLRGIRRLEHHAYKQHFDRASVEAFELCMRAADGIICSTPWLAERYRGINPRTWVCRNGIDLRRYAYERPARDHVGIGWAGGTGHLASARPWMREIAAVMGARDRTRFVSIGAPFGGSFAARFGAERALCVPFLPLEAYPAVMTHFDVAVAPAGQGGFFKGKSDLRWLEASALGIPLVADPVVYPEIQHGVTGFRAETPAEARELLLELVDDEALRRRVGEAAREYVTAHRSAEVAARSWAAVLAEAGEVRAAA